MVSLKDPKVIARVMEEIKAAGRPVTINYLVKEMKLCYNSINTILLNLVIKGKLKQQEVATGASGNSIFWIEGAIPAFREQPGPK